MSLEVWFASCLRASLASACVSLPTLRFPLSTTGLHFFSESLLCAVVKVRVQFPSGVRFAVSFPMNPENDTGSSPQVFLQQQFLFDAVRLCVTHSLSVHTRRFPAFIAVNGFLALASSVRRSTWMQLRVSPSLAP